MTTYNRAKMLPLAIDSILGQTLTDFEFIIVEDGSTDDTADVLHQYAKHDKRIRIIHQHNQGLAAARNNGVASSRSDYIAFMDDDDVSLPQRLARQYDFLSRNTQFAACVCCFQSINRDMKSGVNIVRYTKCPDAKQMLQDQKNLKMIPRLVFLANATTMIKKIAFEKCGGYRPFLTVSEDTDFTLRLQEKYLIGVVPQILYHIFAPFSSFENNSSRLSRKTPMLNLKDVTASYISAWLRRNGYEDPLKSAKGIDSTIRMVPQIPLPTRQHIFRHCLKSPISTFFSHPDLSFEELAAFF